MSSQTSEMSNEQHRAKKKHGAAPYVFGYLSSLVLTAIAFILALVLHVTIGRLLIVITLLAALQIFVQLYFFMHVTESDGPLYHTAFLVLGLIFTFAIALMSVWVMGFSGAMTY